MTGYGHGEQALGGGLVVVEIRAVNHRFLDVRMRLPSALLDHAAAAEDVARRRLERGRVEVSARLEGAAGGAIELDRERARSAFEQLAALRDELRPDEPVPLTLLGCVPDLFRAAGGPPSEDTREALRAATEAACDAADAMRQREGKALAADLDKHLERIVGHVEALRERGPAVVADYRRKLRERLERLLEDTSASLDPGRLEHEVALFADRADVAEELARLHSHCEQFRSIMSESTGAVGRRLDFLLQEMARETNTIGSKSPDGRTTHRVVELKSDVERMREQVQNVL